jgi:hypothetical protein
MFSVGVSEASDRGLADYVNKDLRNLTPAERETFSAKLSGIVPHPDAKNPDIADTFQPLFVKPFGSGKAKWIFLEKYCGWDVPDLSAVRVYLFDETWNKIHHKSYPTGVHVYLAQARVEKSAQFEQDLLVVQVENPEPNEGDYQKQHYAFTGDRMALVRLENKNNQLIPNNYTCSTPMMGGEVPKRTKTEWIETLTSGSTVEQMAALVWLSGSHLKSSEPRQENKNQEAMEDSVLYEEVFNSERTKTAIQKLTKHDSEWIKEYAELVQRSQHQNGQSGPRD